MPTADWFSPVRRGDFAIAEHDGLTRHPFVGGKTARGTESHFDRRGGAEILGAGDDAHFAACANADAAAGVAEGDAGAAGDIEDRLVVSGLGLTAERRE